jgi:hypothetical protein
MEVIPWALHQNDAQPFFIYLATPLQLSYTFIQLPIGSRSIGRGLSFPLFFSLSSLLVRVASAAPDSLSLLPPVASLAGVEEGWEPPSLCVE